MAAVLSSCALVHATSEPMDTPSPPAAKEDCTQQEMAMTTNGLEAARPMSPDSMMATSTAVSQYLNAIADYHVCLAR